MAIGDLMRSEFVASVDEVTGAHVERLTSPKETCHLPAPSVRATSADGRVLLYVSERNLVRQLWAMNLETGTSVQLSSGRGLSEYDGFCLDFDDRHVLFAQGRDVWRVDLVTLLRERVYACEEGSLIQGVVPSRDGSTVVITEMERAWAPSVLAQADWTYFSLSNVTTPHCRLVVVDRASGEARLVADQHRWIGRALPRPGEPHAVLFFHEGPHDAVDARIWLAREGADLESVSVGVGEGMVTTGENWTPDGSGICFLARRLEETERGLTARICVADLEAREERELMACHPFAHFAPSADGRWAVGDMAGGSKAERTDTPGARLGTGETDEMLFLCDLVHGRELRLCQHGSSWGLEFGTAQDTHPHPMVTEDGRSVLFVSDREGRPAIYRVDLARFLWERDAGAGPLEPSDCGPSDGLLPDVGWGFPATF